MALTEWWRVSGVKTTETYNTKNDAEAADHLVVLVLASLVAEDGYRIQKQDRLQLLAVFPSY